jgi:uncharacterized protein (DUF305 family)
MEWIGLKMRLQSICLLVFIVVTLGVSTAREHPSPTSGSESTCWQQLQEGMAKMHVANARLSPSGRSGVDFAHVMIPHHQAAIDMAKVELVCDKDPVLRRLAQEIITDQQQEIEVMQQWLKNANLN